MKGMEIVSNLTTAEIEDLARKTIAANKTAPSINMSAFDDEPEPVEESVSDGGKKRHLLLIGCGDGGCNIAVTVKEKIPNNSYCILYNTSARAMERHMSVADTIVLPKAEDGSGKDRTYSKDVFKRGSFRTMLDEVNKAISSSEDGYDYIVVCSTADGGTGGGVSPTVAKFLKDNTNVPVVILGVLPTLEEDAMAQYNALAWQADVEKSGCPHVIFDNNRYSGTSKLTMHLSINQAIANSMEVLAGTVYGDTLISSIDNRDMLMIMVNAGKRVGIFTTQNRPKVTDTFDSFIMDLMKRSEQPMPKNATAIGIFVKGPKQFIENTDFSLMQVRSEIGNAMMYTHIEESDTVRISVIVAGCSSYDDRMFKMRQRYDDIMMSVNQDTVGASDVMAGMGNPFKTNLQKKVLTSEVDTSALDL